MNIRIRPRIRQWKCIMMKSKEIYISAIIKTRIKSTEEKQKSTQNTKEKSKIINYV